MSPLHNLKCQFFGDILLTSSDYGGPLMPRELFFLSRDPDFVSRDPKLQSRARLCKSGSRLCMSLLAWQLTGGRTTVPDQTAK